jgi:uncharacterized protein
VRVASLHVYPVKGARGITLERAAVLPAGLRYDRRFMVVDDDGVFLSQRKHPRLALVDVALSTPSELSGSLSEARSDSAADATSSDRMMLTTARATASVPLVFATDAPRCCVRVWGDEVDAVDAGDAAAELFSEHLGVRCRLVHMPNDVIRPVDAKYGRPGDHVGFADGYPVLVASLASLSDLNARLEREGTAAVPMNRFRPNVVVEGAAPFEEDSAHGMQIGPVVFRTPKRCSRCQVITVDQATAMTSKEPLRTLSHYRSESNNVYFAMNAIPDLPPGSSAVLAVGDTVIFHAAT